MLQMMNIEVNPHISMLKMTDQGLVMAESVVSSMSHINIMFKISSHGMIGLDSLHKLFDQQEPEVIAISQRLQGVIQGHVLFVLNHETGMQLMRGLLKENARLRELTEMEEEALLELGNIIINSCLSSYLRLNQGKLISHLPRFDRDHYTQIMNEYRADIFGDELFYTQIQISLKDKRFMACLLWTSNP
jgi:chemotaxis protein CheC